MQTTLEFSIMFIFVTVCALSRFVYIISASHACVPNTNFALNDKICYCNNIGQWSEAQCRLIALHQECIPGQTVWNGCTQCTCQENQKFSCTDAACTPPTATGVPPSHNIPGVSQWCTPFRSYYINCKLCLCPASGKMENAQCARDPSCSSIQQPFTSDLTSKIMCIPQVMYIFPCLHCLCPDQGYFFPDRCVKTCRGVENVSPIRCIPNSFYRKDCNICICPADSIPDGKFCSNSVCNQTSHVSCLGALRSRSYKCSPHRFQKPRCLYCDCNKNLTLDENACFEMECVGDVKYDVVRATCSVGETVKLCMECLCLRNGQTFEKYCSKACTYESKLKVLEEILRDSIKDDTLIDKDLIKKSISNEVCDPDTIYVDQGKLCLCPENRNTNFNLCIKEASFQDVLEEEKKFIDFNVTCEPFTFVEFDCNTCFCNKTGNIDPNWCTYDDCDAKRIIQEAHALNINIPKPELNENCSPGSLIKIECNFCICPDSSSIKDLVCTKNDCSSVITPTANDKFFCEPLAYYEVDCNVCFCPRDGLKNVAKCTKNHCERSYLRSDVCVPGQLFSDECNVCVCPPNGNKSDKACTNYTCSDTPWKKIFQLSESLLGNLVPEDVTRTLELCFAGEEFVIGCKLCVCPDMGLRVYATCSPVLCEEEFSEKPNEEFGTHRIIESRRAGNITIKSQITHPQKQLELLKNSNNKTRF